MANKLLDKRIPTVLGMILIIAGLSITTFLTNQQTIFQVGAQANTQPQEVRISNITDNSFTISYTTNTPTSGYVNYGQDNSLNQTSFDETASSQKLDNHTLHVFTLTNLSPKTKYYFVITSGQDKYLDNGKNFEVTTAPSLADSNMSEKISGKVILPNSNPPKEAIVYLTVNGAQTLSAIVGKNGTYNIKLNHLLSQNLSSLENLSKNTELKILILGDTLKSSAIFYFHQLENMPLITLSNNYDFRYKYEKVSSTSAVLNNFPTISALTETATKDDSLRIITPESNQTLKSQKPKIEGTALPNQKVVILIHSQQQIETTVTTDSNGNWSYQPTTNLEPGTHTITVSTTNSSGIIDTITKTFTVYAQETTPILTSSPTATLISDITAISPKPTLQPLPVTGNTSIIAAGIVGLLISVTGGLIFFLSRKIS